MSPDARNSFVAARWIFLRAVGAILVIAFLSLWVQIHGLAGEQGILPAAKYLDAVREAVPGFHRFTDFPTIFWIGAGDAVLSVACAIGVIAGLAVIAGDRSILLTRIALIVAWIDYLSLSTITRVFLGFQWDILLLEVIVTSIFLVPRIPRVGALGLNRFLLFKLVFSSGAVKLLSGDETWRNWTALQYHYETQPLPTPLAWYAHQWSPSFQHFSVGFTFFAQLIAPIALFLPRPARLGAVSIVIFHQILIALTGNYCFFNFTALALCVLFIDDGVLKKIAQKLRRDADREPPKEPHFVAGAARSLVLAVLITANGLVLAQTLQLSSSRAELLDLLAPTRSVNGYGLFRLMTTTRNEIIIEGSNDGETWLPYELPDKPGALDRAPSFVAPHQPRLDWQMWFAALRTPQHNPWFQGLLLRLFEGSGDVLSLFEKNPFPEAPPKYLRAELYLYHFTNAEERAATGNWWKREYLSPWFPAVQKPVRGSSP